jgi:hypothetical protein
MVETKRCEIGEQLENRFLVAVQTKINGQKKDAEIKQAKYELDLHDAQCPRCRDSFTPS